jgi:hypothetical protein
MRQFPWIFELKEALAREGTDATYPDLLMQSGEIWRFAYPQAGLGRQMEPDPNRLLNATSRYGLNTSWLDRQALASLRETSHEKQTTGPAAFDDWAKSIEAQMRTCSTNVDSRVFLDSLDGCLYLANTRTLAIRHGFEAPVGKTKGETLRSLQEELRTLHMCVEILHEMILGGLSVNSCECSERANRLIDGIRKIGELEKQAGRGPAISR